MPSRSPGLACSHFLSFQNWRPTGFTAVEIVGDTPSQPAVMCSSQADRFAYVALPLDKLNAVLHGFIFDTSHHRADKKAQSVFASLLPLPTEGEPWMQYTGKNQSVSHAPGT